MVLHLHLEGPFLHPPPLIRRQHGSVASLSDRPCPLDPPKRFGVGHLGPHRPGPATPRTRVVSDLSCGVSRAWWRRTTREGPPSDPEIAQSNKRGSQRHSRHGIVEVDSLPFWGKCEATSDVHFSTSLMPGPRTHPAQPHVCALHCFARPLMMLRCNDASTEWTPT